MKKLLLAAAACCVMGAPSMFGNNVFESCPVFFTSFTAGTGSATITCPGANVPGTVTSIEIFDESDFDGGSTSANSVTVTFIPDTTFDTWAPTTVNCTVTGNGSSNANTCGVYSGDLTAPGTTSQAANPGGLAALNTNGWTVAVSSVVNSGGVNQSTAGVIAEFDYTISSGTPEPGSMLLLGGGLLVAGLIGRKKLVKK